MSEDKIESADIVVDLSGGKLLIQKLGERIDALKAESEEDLDVLEGYIEKLKKQLKAAEDEAENMKYESNRWFEEARDLLAENADLKANMTRHALNYRRQYIKDLEAERDRIMPFVRHKPHCKMGEYNSILTGKGCDCGLSEALKEKNNVNRTEPT